MADRPTETTTAPQGAVDSATGGVVDGREDTVAIPRTPPAGATNGTSNGAPYVGSNGSARTATPPAVPPPAAAPVPTRSPRENRKAARGARNAARREVAAQAAPARGRKARLRLTRVDPWSVMKTAFLLSIALGIVTVVSVLMVWTVLGAADVWQSINKTVQDIVGGQDASDFNIEDYVGTRRVVGFTMIVAAVDVVLVTAIATLGAFLYNMSASLLGGIEVTLAEDA